MGKKEELLEEGRQQTGARGAATLACVADFTEFRAGPFDPFDPLGGWGGVTSLSYHYLKSRLFMITLVL